MNIKTLRQKIEANLYGEQSIVEDAIESFIWSGYKTRVITNLYNKVKADQIVAGSEFVEDEEQSIYNDSIDFPSVTYIPYTFEYQYAKKVEKMIGPIQTNGTTTIGNLSEESSNRFSFPVDGSGTKSWSLLRMDRSVIDTDSSVIRMTVNIKSDINEWEFIIVVATKDTWASNGDPIEVTIYPRKAPTQGQTAKTHMMDAAAPQFFNAKEGNELDLKVVLPQIIGREYTLSFSIDDYFTTDKDLIKVCGDLILVEEQSGDVSFSGNLILPSVGDMPDQSEWDSIDVIEPKYNVYNFTDLEMEAFMTYLTTITNMTSDEYQAGREQQEANSSFTSRILAFPSEIYKTMPIELKLNNNNKPNLNKLGSGTRLIARRY